MLNVGSCRVRINPRYRVRMRLRVYLPPLYVAFVKPYTTLHKGLRP
jgi:hypothetical protein